MARAADRLRNPARRIRAGGRPGPPRFCSRWEWRTRLRRDSRPRSLRRSLQGLMLPLRLASRLTAPARRRPQKLQNAIHVISLPRPRSGAKRNPAIPTSRGRSNAGGHEVTATLEWQGVRAFEIACSTFSRFTVLTETVNICQRFIRPIEKILSSRSAERPGIGAARFPRFARSSGSYSPSCPSAPADTNSAR